MLAKRVQCTVGLKSEPSPLLGYEARAESTPSNGLAVLGADSSLLIT